MKELLFFLLLSIHADTMAQRYESIFDSRAIYRLTCQTDSLDSGSVQQSIWYLFINESESLFQEKYFVEADSLAYFHPKEYASLPKRSGVPMSPVDKNRYKIIKSMDTITVFDEVIGRDMYGKTLLFEYKEAKSVFSWQLSADTINIGGLMCQIAYANYAGRSWIAYFAPSIPIDDGPYKFSGLPGLVIRVHDDKNYWHFEMVNFQKLEDKRHLFMNFQSTYIFKRTDKSEFFKMRKSFQDNMIPMMESAGAEFDEMLKTRIENKMKKDNNWIELYP